MVINSIYVVLTTRDSMNQRDHEASGCSKSHILLKMATLAFKNYGFLHFLLNLTQPYCIPFSRNAHYRVKV